MDEFTSLFGFRALSTTPRAPTTHMMGKMKRTASGSEIEKLTEAMHRQSELPYIYMPPTTQDGEAGMFSPDSRRKVHFHSGGGFVSPHCNRAVIKLPWFTAEISGGFITASTRSWWPKIIFRLPLSCISRASVRPAARELEYHCWSAVTCCVRKEAAVLELMVDAPADWLHGGPSGIGMTGRVTMALFVREVDAWLDEMGLHDRLHVS